MSSGKVLVTVELDASPCASSVCMTISETAPVCVLSTSRSLVSSGKVLVTVESDISPCASSVCVTIKLSRLSASENNSLLQSP